MTTKYRNPKIYVLQTREGKIEEYIKYRHDEEHIYLISLYFETTNRFVRIDQSDKNKKEIPHYKWRACFYDGAPVFI